MKLIILLLLVTAASPEERFLEGLRERRLYRLAEIECREKLAASQLTEAQRVDLVIQLALISVDQALDATPGERNLHWENALQACDEYLERYPNVPRSLLVALQRALVDITRGEVEQLEAIGTPDEAQRLAAANEHLRGAIRRLEKLRETIESARNGLKPELLVEGGFGSEELDSLAGNVSLETARALSRQAACFPPGSADRDDAVLRALALLEPLAAKMPTDEFVWRARLEMLACLRQLDRLEEAQKQLAAWLVAAPPDALLDALLAERLRLLLAAKRSDEAFKLAAQASPSRGSDADLARLETFVAVWQRQPDEQLTQSINDLLDRIRQQHGPAATRRAETLVGRAFADSPDANNPLGLLAAAEHLFHAGKLDEALTTYDRAAETFAQAGNADASFSAALTAATIEKERGNLATAAERYRKLALSQPQQKEAAVVHQAAILALADALRANSEASDEQSISLYELMLSEHLATWKDSPTADDARWWLAQYLASGGKTAEALEILATISAVDEHATAAVELAGILYAQSLEALPRDSAEAREALGRATLHLQPMVLGVDQRWPQSWTRIQRAAALALAKLHLKYGLPGHDYAQRMLLAGLRGAPAPDSDWQTEAAGLLIVALVRGGQTGQAIEWLQQTAGQRASDALSLLDALLADLQSAPSERRTALAGVLLAAVDTVAAKSKGDAEMESLLVRYRAAALAGLGRDQEALSIYKTLAPQRPRDGDIQEEYAALLARGDSTSAREQALRQWQAVERSSRQGSPRWFRARLARITLLQQLDRRDEAAKLLALTRLVHPDLGGAEMRTQFEAL